MISDREIASAKSKTVYKIADQHHEHNDCIRMAYEWLDAQKKTKNPTKKTYALKHIIESWTGRYVSMSDVEVAAFIHPGIYGKYPYFNISELLTEPSKDRLKDIPEAFTQSYRDGYDNSVYKIHE